MTSSPSRLLFSILLTIVVFAKSSHQTRRIRDTSGGSVPPQSNGRIANYAIKALGSFKRFMTEGSNDLGIPTLDPVHMENFNYSLENNPVGFRMEIIFESPSLVGLSNYELNGASEIQTTDGTVLQMTIVFPTIQIKGFFKANGNLFGFFQLGGQGEFEIVGTSQVLGAEARLKVVNDTLNVDYIASQFVGGKVKSHFTDPNSTGPFAGLLTEFLSAMGTYVFDNKLKPVMTMAMNAYTKEWLNGAFSSVTLNEILSQNNDQPHPQQSQSYNNAPPQQPQQPQVQQQQQLQPNPGQQQQFQPTQSQQQQFQPNQGQQQFYTQNQNQNQQG